MAFVCAAAMSFTACVNEEDDLFSKTAAERLNEASALYSDRLCASPNGWAVQLYPTTQDEAPYGSGYLLMFRFHKDKSVDASMNNTLSNNHYLSATSTWDVIADNGPVLSFNTYNKVVHTFSDPEDVPSTGTVDDPNDETGTGIGGDYEFIIVDAPEDASYMMLKGKKRGTYNLLTPVAEGIDFESYLADVKDFKNKMFPSVDLCSDTLHVGDLKYKFEGANDGLPSIYLYNQDKVTTETFNPFLLTKRDNDYYLRFRDKTTYGDLSFQELKYNGEKDVFEDVNNPAIYIEGANPAYVLDSMFVKNSNGWVLDKGMQMSDDAMSIYSDIEKAFSAKKLRLNNISIRRSDKTPVIRITYNTKTIVDYNFNVVNNSDGETFEYVSASGNGAILLQSVPQIQNLLNMFSQRFITSAATTRFDLTKIKLTSASNPNIWFVVYLK